MQKYISTHRCRFGIKNATLIERIGRTCNTVLPSLNDMRWQHVSMPMRFPLHTSKCQTPQRDTKCTPTRIIIAFSTLVIFYPPSNQLLVQAPRFVRTMTYECICALVPLLLKRSHPTHIRSARSGSLWIDYCHCQKMPWFQPVPVVLQSAGCVA